MLSKIKKTKVVGLREAAAVVYRVGGISGFFQVHFMCCGTRFSFIPSAAALDKMLTECQKNAFAEPCT